MKINLISGMNKLKNIKKLEQSEYDSLTKNSIELLRMEYNLENFHNSF